eukprot:scaffold142708_cov157-Phaeocystis_antarctica.AAC.1
MVGGYARLQEVDRQCAEESRAEAKTRHVEEHALRFEVRLLASAPRVCIPTISRALAPRSHRP